MASMTETFTIGVFKDADWAARGLEALGAQGIEAAMVSLLAVESAEAAALAKRVTGLPAQVLEIPGVGRCVGVGPLLAVLLADDAGLTRKGLAPSLARAGFQAHDGRIFETLTARGGVMVAIASESRAADALATLHSYGGGNAAIGAWHGRV